MFTGLIRDFGEVISFKDEKLTISSNLEPNLGDSIAVNGACLTVVEIGKKSFSVELSLETQKTVAIQNYKNRVHLEPAMRLSDRVEGHIVQGHIDSIGTVCSITKSSKFYDVILELSSEAFIYSVPKGSIAIDGVSLTINSIDETSKTIRLTIIPHTFENTLFATYRVGQKVNVESDMMVRTIFHYQKISKKEYGWDFFDKMSAIY